MATKAEPEGSALWSLGLLSASALSLEILLTKFLAYSVSALLIYVVLGVALLGFGAGGTVTTAFPRWSEGAEPENRLAWAANGYAISTLVSFAVFTRLTDRLVGFDALTVFAAALLVLPFFASGVVVAIALRTATRVRTAYGANLVGSAVGCVAPLLLIRPMGGERLLVFTAAMGWAAAWLYARRTTESRLRLATWIVAGLLFPAAVFAEPLYSPRPEPPPLGQLRIARDTAARLGVTEKKLYDRWNATGRIQIFGYDGVPGAPGPYPFLFYAQDSSAGSCLARWDGAIRGAEAEGAPPGEIARACRQTPWGQAYFAGRSRVLVIGLGGGMDVQCALYNGASSVDVVEINPDSIAAVRGPFDDWVGRIGSNPNVHYRLGDGRSFVHRTRDRYDVIQLSGVDTKNSVSSGGLALSENTLYTAEAFVDYLERLNDGGVLSIVRFSDPEAVRLASTATDALRSIGAEHPEAHVIVLENGYVRGVLVTKSPLSEREVRAVEAQYRPVPDRPYGVGIFFYEAFGMNFEVPPRIVRAPGRASTGPVARYYEAAAAGKTTEFLRSYEFDAVPATDDRPFFFDVFRYRGPEVLLLPHVRVLASVLSAILVLALGLLLLPALGRRLPTGASLPTRSVFFASVGLAYLFVEVWLIHTFATYLGHQTYSLGVVLFALLAASGAGSAAGERLEPGRGILVGVVGITGSLALGALALPSVLDATTALPLGARAAVVVGYTGVLGTFMGLPFAQGLAALRPKFESVIPWCIGLNGFASVIATLAVVPASHAFGYRAVMLLGGGLYLVAAAAFLPSARRSSISVTSGEPARQQ